VGNRNLLWFAQDSPGVRKFHGLSAEAVRQDFHATVYLSGLESLLTNTEQAMLDTKATQYPQTVNRAVSFNAIKTTPWICC